MACPVYTWKVEVLGEDGAWVDVRRVEEGTLKALTKKDAVAYSLDGDRSTLSIANAYGHHTFRIAVSGVDGYGRSLRREAVVENWWPEKIGNQGQNVIDYDGYFEGIVRVCGQTAVDAHLKKTGQSPASGAKKVVLRKAPKEGAGRRLDYAGEGVEVPPWMLRMRDATYRTEHLSLPGRIHRIRDLRALVHSIKAAK